MMTDRRARQRERKREGSAWRRRNETGGEKIREKGTEEERKAERG